MPTSRTFKVESPLMHGADIKKWQQEIKAEFKGMGIDCPIVPDGIWGVSSRGFMASLTEAIGMLSAEVMAKGVTPELRTRIRSGKSTVDEKKRMAHRIDYRRALRERWESATVNVHRLTAKVITDAWGYHPGVHDGIDVQTPPSAVLYAMVKCKVIDVRGGPGDPNHPSRPWWGNNPSGDTRKGDGIVQVEVLETVGPFVKGHHIGYGHCENARVFVGDVLEAGDPIALTGKAVTWHVHLMHNTGNTDKGVGNVDPRKILDYAQKHG